MQASDILSFATKVLWALIRRTSILSIANFVALAGIVVGAVVALKYKVWRVERAS